jgi:Predicted signal-transduction protein containing cAMP-binding and CBS domains
MASNILWRKSISGWKKQIDLWTSDMAEQNLRYIDMLYDFKSVFGKPELADELRVYILKKLQNKNVLKFLYKSEEAATSGLNFFGGFVLEKTMKIILVC